MEKQVVIRVGEKNNFNQSIAELKELQKYKGKGKIFLNSNSFNPIAASCYPSFVTINPYLKFHAITGFLNNVKAVRIKLFISNIPTYTQEQIKCIEFCVKNGLNILITFQRYLSIESAEKYSGSAFREDYTREAGYFRPTKETKACLVNWCRTIAKRCNNHADYQGIFTCDNSGNGCPDCMNCSFLSYGLKENVTIKALNLSISGVNDREGRKGICPYNCPDCFAKRVCFGKRPQVDKLITNRKIKGEL